jgi:hypothetical protein
MVTKHGKELARDMSKYMGFPYDSIEAFSLIARHSKTLRRLYEMECGDGIHSGEWVNDNYAWIEKRTERIEKRLSDIAATLPETDHGPVVLELQGDPRGWVVRFIVPTDNGPRTVGVW